ncbi:hypothetical protein B0H11DRAFT_1025652 [Mycena galericulata]|nr:hypothetical protein B0H11DRAFT_1025652 [Mycena galericulata]
MHVTRRRVALHQTRAGNDVPFITSRRRFTRQGNLFHNKFNPEIGVVLGCGRSPSPIRWPRVLACTCIHRFRLQRPSNSKSRNSGISANIKSFTSGRRTEAQAVHCLSDDGNHRLALDHRMSVSFKSAFHGQEPFLIWASFVSTRDTIARSGVLIS